MKDIEDSISELIGELKMSHKKWMGDVRNQIDEKVYSLSLSVAQKKKQNLDIHESSVQAVTLSLSEVKEAIEEERV